MILETVERGTKMSGIGETKSFGIKEKDFGFLTGVLSSKIYSDKPMAVVREYLANAFDANRLAGSKIPVKITVPTQFEPVLKIRDFGAGMHPDFVEDTFIYFGDSTKREDETSTGCLGLGAKAGFAYTDCFNISSYYNGICYNFTAQKDRFGTLQLIKVGEEATPEPNGVEIAVPVSFEDCQIFCDKVVQCLKYIREPYVVEGLTVPTVKYVYTSDEFCIEQSDYYQQSKVLMGNIIYPIETHHLKMEYHGIKNIILNCKLGDVDFAVDREKLEYTEKTIDFLNERFFCILEKLKEDTQKNIDSKAHPWEFIDLVRCLNQSFKGVSFNLSDFTYKGKEIPTNKIRCTYYTEQSWRRIKIRKQSDATVQVNSIDEKSVLVIAPPMTNIQHNRFFDGFEQKNGWRPSMVFVSDDKTLQENLLCQYWKPEQIVSDYKALWSKVVRGTLSGNTAVWLNNRHRRNLLNVSDNKFYVATSGSCRTNLGAKDSNYIYYARNNDIDFYSINEKKAKNLDSTWRKLSDYIDEVTDKELATIDPRANLIASEILNIKNFDKVIRVIEEYPDVFENNDAAKIIKKWKKVSDTHNQKIESILKLRTSIGKPVVFKDSGSIAAEADKIKDFIKKYDLPIEIFNCVPSWNMSSILSAKIKEYIKTIDKTATL